MNEYMQCRIEFSFCFNPALSEIPLDDSATTEAVVEGQVSELLAELFAGTGSILVEDVSVRYFPATYTYDDSLPHCA